MKRFLLLILGCCMLFQIHAGISRTLSFDPQQLSVTTVTMNDTCQAKTADDDQQISRGYEPLVVEGRTWWYGHNSFWGWDSKDYGVRIGKKVNINDVIWHEVKVIKSIDHDKLGNYFNPKDEDILLAYIREYNGKVYSKLMGHFIDRPFVTPETNDNQEYLIYDFNDEIGSQFVFGDKDPNITFKIDEIARLSNSGYEYQQWSANPIDEQNMHTYQYLNKIGITQPFAVGKVFYYPYGLATLDGYTSSFLRYVTEGENNDVIYEAAGGLKLWDVTEDVENVSVNDNSSQPVEYFDLQGVGITNPTSGSVVVRRQGMSVTKIIVR